MHHQVLVIKYLVISDVTNETITHLIYSHSYKDHIGAAHIFQQPGIEIVAQKETGGYSQNEKGFRATYSN